MDYNLDNIRLYGEAAPMLISPLVNTTVGPGGTARLGVKAFGSTYQIEYLNEAGGGTTWQQLTTLTLTTSPAVWIDLDSINHPRRFYRAIALP